MIKAEIINSQKRKSKISCSKCSLSYSARDYHILYENEKLAFFKAKFPPERKKNYCHDCLYKVASELLRIRGGKKMQVLMTTKEGKEVVITFYRD